MKKLLAISALVLVSVSGCYREDDLLPFIGYDYFPTELGKFVEYKVDSIWQDDVIGPIGSAEAHYFLQDINESDFVDEEGRPAVRVERFWKQTEQGSYNFIKDVWSRTRTSEVAEQNEENVIFIKHNFPVREGKTWDGNRKNILQTLQETYQQVNVPEVWNYEYVDVHQPYTINGFTFDSTVTVIQFDRQTQIALSIFAKEVYAKDVGLIHKQLYMHNIQNSGLDSVGFTFDMVVTDFGSL